MSKVKGYNYTKIFTDHLNSNKKKVFNGELIYPRQMEIHLPADREIACNFKCNYCQGGSVSHLLDNWEPNALSVLDIVGNQIPFHIFGGVYTEPLMNEYLPDFIDLTTRHSINFGIHTNGSLFTKLEDDIKFCSQLIKAAKSESDYISVSLDGASPKSHSFIKNVKEDFFTRIMQGIKLLCDIRGKNKFPKIRVTYLMQKKNSDPVELEQLVNDLKSYGVDSLRFSVPYAHYGRSHEKVKEYKKKFEDKFGPKAHNIVKKFISKKGDKTNIFWFGAENQDVTRMNFKQCVYSYYQITFAADGYVYKCSSTAAPEFSHTRLGKVPSTVPEFNDLVLKNHDKLFNATNCWINGARCNRIALEINDQWRNNDLFSG